MPPRRIAALAGLAALATAGAASTQLYGCNRDTTRHVCVDPRTVRTCAEGYCNDQTCRGDEVCSGNGCVYWEEADLWTDFELTPDAEDPLTVHCRVAPGGFPRLWAQHVRVSFGDDTTGWGESTQHTYAAPGIYPVELEVTLERGHVLTASRLAVVGKPAADWVPFELTVDAIPGYLNGSRPYHSDNGTPDPADDYDRPFSLVLPTHGFSVDLTLLANPKAPVVRNSISLTADRDLGGGTLPAGTNLIRHLQPWTDAQQKLRAARGAATPKHERHLQRVERRRWLVQPGELFPEGPVRLTMTAITRDGRRHSQSLTFTVESLSPARQPFDRPLTWLLRFDRDFFTAASVPVGDGRFRITARPGANGKPDFAEELALLGAQSADRAQGARSVVAHGRTGASAIYLAWIEDELKTQIRRYYRMLPDGTPLDGISFGLYTDADPDAPKSWSFRKSGEFSLLRLGGTLNGDLGRSYFGVYNENRVDDSEGDVGVATADILSSLSASRGLTEVLDPIKPGVGVPVGQHPLDAVVLSEQFDRFDPANSERANARYDALADIARFIALAIANVAAHEMGHGMGLVPNGEPPDGFFGGRRDVTFMQEHTDSHHADFPPLNLMQAGDSLLATLTTSLGRIEYPTGEGLADLARAFAFDNRLSPYELAYLQGRLTYRNFDGPTKAAYIGCH